MTLEFMGTCVSREISTLAEKYGRPSSYKNACRMIKESYPDIYHELALNLRNPWAYMTNTKTINGEKILHIVHSQTDYLFKKVNS